MSQVNSKKVFGRKFGSKPTQTVRESTVAARVTGFYEINVHNNHDAKPDPVRQLRSVTEQQLFRVVSGLRQ